MYITSELFSVTAAPTHNCGDNTTSTSTSTHWTTMTDAPHTAGLGKRKRPEETDAECMRNSRLHRRSSPLSRSLNRFQPHNHSPFDSNRNLPYSIAYFTPERRPVKQMKRLSPKPTLTKSTSHLMDIEPDMSPALSTTTMNLNTRPCHACKSAPRRRKDLENYMDCRRCDGRTCYICARQCFGGCGKAMCKKCIVEVGEEGDPWCLDCYARNLNS
ncbi:hypothetical protein GQ44DRAFT_600751 [Phaeosphaeriaceae sp. PMI808]|nr:hypothetical protein GQ44DRAFT_600751 [Phaeosphaeriaceae sp. PMI808]